MAFLAVDPAADSVHDRTSFTVKDTHAGSKVQTQDVDVGLKGTLKTNPKKTPKKDLKADGSSGGKKEAIDDDTRLQVARYLSGKAENKQMLAAGERESSATPPECSDAEKKAAPKGFEEFGSQLCGQFKKEDYKIFPFQLKVDKTAQRGRLLQAVSKAPSGGGQLLLVAESMPEVRLPGDIGQPGDETDVCGCAPGD